MKLRAPEPVTGKVAEVPRFPAYRRLRITVTTYEPHQHSGWVIVGPVEDTPGATTIERVKLTNEATEDIRVRLSGRDSGLIGVELGGV